MNVKLGTVIEIKTKLGLAYAQYTHRMPPYGALIRVFEEIHRRRPGTLEGIVSDKVRFSAFFPINSALIQCVVENVGTAEISNVNEEFPTFRFGHIDHKTKKIDRWFLWNGKAEWEAGELSIEQRRYPIRGVWNVDLLIERIDENWRPEIDTR